MPEEFIKPDFSSGVKPLYARIQELETELDARVTAYRDCAMERNYLRAIVDVLEPVARLYVQAFREDEIMTLPERLRLQEVEIALDRIDSRR